MFTTSTAIVPTPRKAPRISASAAATTLLVQTWLANDSGVFCE